MILCDGRSGEIREALVGGTHILKTLNSWKTNAPQFHRSLLNFNLIEVALQERLILIMYKIFELEVKKIT